eukprot:TRINITY_DN34015_c0_g1_i1.p1 TRINITY_DN34015_c0_g1~~TRINITY_DN34015_c0_g1_i1.p1  ORF type:complete len:206 (+),score=66.32 TRINITY_DN34015_c0_g1_i1:80-619(+)
MPPPRVVVFDLDGCLWYPEMYHLWGGGGAPFTPAAGGDLTDRAGTPVRLIGATRAALRELHQQGEEFRGTEVGVASCTDEPSWARECIQKFQVAEGLSLGDIVRYTEIHKGNKREHLARIAKSAGCRPEEMMFFDNERHNLQAVAPLGVTCIYCSDGVTAGAWELAKRSFPRPGEILHA